MTFGDYPDAAALRIVRMRLLIRRVICVNTSVKRYLTSVTICTT